MLKNQIKNWLFISLIIIACSCRTYSQVKWTLDSELTTYEGGGMVPDSKTVIIKNLSGSYIHWHQHKRDTLYFKLSQAELNDLVKQLNVSNFNSIISGETGGIAYDKPTTSVELKQKGKSHEVNVGATTGIKKGDAGAFYDLYHYILNMALKKTGQLVDEN